MKNILITGINGFIGKAFVEHLKSKYNIYGIDRQSDCHIPSIKRYDMADIACFDQLKDLASNQAIDHIIHCAAAITNDSKTVFESNILGTWNVYQFARLLNCKSIVYISSLPIIGTPLLHPVTESHPINPQTNYHLSKYIGELLLTSQKDIPVFSFRITSPIGVGMRPNTILSTYIRQCMDNEPLTVFGEGSRKQDYIDVKDISLAVSLALESEGKNSGIYNIASAHPFSNKELASNCKSILQSRSEIITKGEDPLDGIIWDISIEKAMKKLGFLPLTSIIQSVKAIAESYENSDM